jgi:hypothetical protein
MKSPQARSTTPGISLSLDVRDYMGPFIGWLPPSRITVTVSRTQSNLRRLENTVSALTASLKASATKTSTTSRARTSVTGSRKARSAKSGSTTSSSRSGARSRRR